MSSGHKKELTTTSTSKGGGATVIGETHIIPPDCEDLLLAVTTDDSVSGTVDANIFTFTDCISKSNSANETDYDHIEDNDECQVIGTSFAEGSGSPDVWSSQLDLSLIHI